MFFQWHFKNQKTTENVKGTDNQFLWCLFLSTMESLLVRLYNRAAVTRKTPWNIFYWNFFICSEGDVVIPWKYAGNSERCAGIGEKETSAVVAVRSIFLFIKPDVPAIHFFFFLISTLASYFRGFLSNCLVSHKSKLSFA